MGIVSAADLYCWLDPDSHSACSRNWREIRFMADEEKKKKAGEGGYEELSHLCLAPEGWIYGTLGLTRSCPWQTLLISQVTFPTELGYSLRTILGTALWAAATNLSGWLMRLIYWVHYLFIYSTFIRHLNWSRHVKVIPEWGMKLTF